MALTKDPGNNSQYEFGFELQITIFFIMLGRENVCLACKVTPRFGTKKINASAEEVYMSSISRWLVYFFLVMQASVFFDIHIAFCAKEAKTTCLNAYQMSY